jgi:DNA invertase Pin-like site-specific DNA recombinase
MTRADAEPVRAALYARVSGREQVENTSLLNQEQRLRAYAAGLGWEVFDVYVDKAESGAKESRPEINRLMADAKAGHFEKVVVLKLDRWSRDVPHLRASVRELDAFGVALVSVSETLDLGSPMGRAMLNLLGTFSELERDTIRDRTLSGRRARAAAGGWPGGNAPFGYRIVDHPDGPKAGKVAVPDPDEAATVQRAAALLVDHGMSSGDAARTLNAEGRLRKTGTRWTHQTLTRMLRSDVLLGRYTFSRPAPAAGKGHPQRDRRRTEKVVMRVNGQDVVTRRDVKRGQFGPPIELALEPILDEATFAVVQQKLDAAALGPRTREDRFYSLSGRLFYPCDQEPSGVPAHGLWRDQGGPEGTTRMRCRNTKVTVTHPESCNCPALLERPLADAVWGAVVDLIADPAYLATLTAQRLERLGGGTELDVPALDARIEQQETQMTTELLKMVRAGLDETVLARVRQELQGDLDALRAQRAALKASEALQRANAASTGRLASVAAAGRERLLALEARGRAQVYDLLDLRVEIIDFGKPSGPLSERRPPSFSMSGRLAHGLTDALFLSPASAGDLTGAASGRG